MVRKKIVIFIYTIVFTFCLALFILLSLNTENTDNRLWRDYYLLLIPGEQPLPQVIGDLKARLDPAGIVSAESAEIAVTRFSDMEMVRLADLEARLDPADPRRDPYMQAMQNFFQLNPDQHLVFVASRLSALAFYRQIVHINREKEYAIAVPGIDLLEKGLVFILALLFTATYLIVTRRKKFTLLKLLGALPWIYYSAAGGFNNLVLFLVTYPCWFLLVEETAVFLEEWLNHHRISTAGLCLKLAVFLFAIAIALLFYLKSPNLPFPLLPILANCVLAGGFLCLDLGFKTGKEHTLFRLVPFTGHRKFQWGKIKFRNIVYIFFLILVIPAIPFYYNNRSSIHDVTIPVPVPVSTGRQLGTKNYNTMLLYHNKDNLPSFAAYLAHMAYQESIGYAGTYASALRSGVAIGSYQIRTAGITRTSTSPIAFNEPWLKRVAAGLGADSLEKMLFSQPGPGEMALVPGRHLFRDKYSLWQEIGLLFFLVIPLFFLYFYLTPALLYGIKNLITRRKRNTA